VEVVGVDCINDSYGRDLKLANLGPLEDFDRFDLLEIDLADADPGPLLAGSDVVFHLAAEPGVRPSWGQRFDSYLRNNVTATQRLLEAAVADPPARFVYASSSSVYGQAEAFPTPEDALPRPHSPYGVTKLDAENLCRLYHANFGVPAVALRYFSVYGPRQRPDMAFNRFCRAALGGSPIEVFGDGRQTRDFTYVADVVRATRAAATAPGADGRVYNVGGGSQVSLAAAIELIESIAGKRFEVAHRPSAKGDVKDTGADTARARAELGFEASVGLEEGLAAEFAWTTAASRPLPA
jgi:UDP-glucuronate 4-epimerase